MEYNDWLNFKNNIENFRIDLAHHFKCSAPFFGNSHYHNGICQISFVIDGSCRIKVDGREYPVSNNDFVIVFPGEIHESLDSRNDQYELIDVKFSSAVKEALDSIPYFPTVTRVVDTPAVFSALQRLIGTHREFNNPGGILVSLYLLELLLLVSGQYETFSGVDDDAVLNVRRSAKYISKHYYKQISLDELAAHANLSLSRFTSLFKETYAVSPIERLIQVRIERAKEFLMYSNYSIKQIAVECGFNSPQYFSRQFFRRTGKRPKEYREQPNITF
jgi:AraC family transcriptional regulator, arabinose operon regulatory protein